MDKQVVIIGAGPGGYGAAVRAAQLGADVTVIEEDQVGGTCLNRGCVPSKVMIETAKLWDRFHRAEEFGIDVDGRTAVNMMKVMARKEKVIRDQADGILGLLRRHNIRYLSGRGYIERPSQVIVRQNDGTTITVNWDRLILATGTEPLELPEFPFDGNRILSSDDVLCLKDVPSSILIVGGGVVGCEFAFMLQSLGTRVVLVEGLPRLLPLPSVDDDCSKIIQREMKKRKIRVLLSRTVTSVAVGKERLTVDVGPSPFGEAVNDKVAAPLTVQVDKVLVCVGRKPNTSELGLERLGNILDEKGWVVTDDRMQTRVPNVYAVGDLLGPTKPMLAHVASTEAAVAAENAVGDPGGMGESGRRMDYDVVPNVIFTMPEVAGVGLTEKQAKAKGIAVRSDTVLFRTIGKAQITGEIAGQAKILSDVETGEIRGIHLVGPHVTELIAQAALAIEKKATLEDLAETIHAHPTLAEIMLETSLKALGRPRHG